MMLLQAAANAWNVPVAEVTVEKGVISHKASNRTTTYGKVADAAAKLPVPEKPALKDPKTWTIAGKPLKRLDTAGKVNGSQKYSHRLHHAGNAVRRHEGVPGDRRQARELRRRQGREACRA